MSEIILFRGKAIDGINGGCEHNNTNYKNGEWVYGLVYGVDEVLGTMNMVDENDVGGIDVDPNTIGQYTNLKDRNGKEIFEGDIVNYSGTNHLVVFEHRNGAAYFGIAISEIETWGFSNSVPADKMEVLGNIYDNPELLT